MIARYYKCNVSRDYLFTTSMTGNDGTSMYGLMVAATSLGFISYGKKGKVSDLDKKSLPVIAHIKIDEKKNLYHYVVITNITDKKVTIKDPRSGSKVFSIEEFSKIETGNYLFIKKTASIKRFVKRRIIKDEIVRLVDKNKPSFILIIISIILGIVFELLNMFSLKVILNNAILVKSIYNLSILLFIFFYLLILKHLMSYFWQLLLLKLSKYLNYQLKLDLIKQLLSLPNLYYQTKERGIILSLFNDIDTFTDSIFTSFTTVINSIVILSFIYIFFMTLSLYLTIILVISSIVLFIFIYSQKKLRNSLITKYYAVKDKYNSNLQQFHHIPFYHFYF